ncbi:MAG: type III pantothenate kinase [bacterium]
MLLATDIGNTHVTIGVYSKERLLAHWRLSSDTVRTEDESWIMLTMLCHSAGLDPARLTGCVVSSVVPDLTHIYATMAKSNLAIPCVVIDANLDTGLRILYKDPMSVGADRICNAVAGHHKYAGPLIIVDFGTATTFDVVSEEAEYLGGVICPGVESSSYILHRYAARLPKVELRFPKKLVARTTESSMQAGIMYGTVEMVNGLVRRLLRELGRQATIIATGGIADQLIEKLDMAPKLEPLLTLEGMRLIYERVKK